MTQQTILRRYLPATLLWCDFWVALYAAVAMLCAWQFSYTNDWNLALDFTYDPPFLYGVVAFWAVYVIYRGIALFVTKSDSQIFGPTWRAMIRRVYCNGAFFVNIIHLFLALKLLLVVHALIKQRIALINPELYDDTLLWLDTVMHGGINISRLGGEKFSGPAVGTFFDRAYVSWYTIKLPVIFVFFVIENQVLSQRFFFALFGLWVIGGLAAVLLPSLGPIYVWPEWFSNLQMPLARGIQQQLWSGHLELLHNAPGFIPRAYEGIAAFPSLHVGVVAIYACFLWELHRFWGVCGVLYTALIQAGSVYLGWHYAIDGYWCILLAYLLYRISNRVTSKTNSG